MAEIPFSAGGIVRLPADRVWFEDHLICQAAPLLATGVTGAKQLRSRIGTGCDSYAIMTLAMAYNLTASASGNSTATVSTLHDGIAMLSGSCSCESSATRCAIRIQQTLAPQRLYLTQDNHRANLRTDPGDPPHIYDLSTTAPTRTRGDTFDITLAKELGWFVFGDPTIQNEPPMFVTAGLNIAAFDGNSAYAPQVCWVAPASLSDVIEENQAWPFSIELQSVDRNAGTVAAYMITYMTDDPNTVAGQVSAFQDPYRRSVRTASSTYSLNEYYDTYSYGGLSTSGLVTTTAGLVLTGTIINKRLENYTLDTSTRYFGVELMIKQTTATSGGGAANADVAVVFGPNTWFEYPGHTLNIPYATVLSATAEADSQASLDLYVPTSIVYVYLDATVTAECSADLNLTAGLPVEMDAVLGAEATADLTLDALHTWLDGLLESNAFGVVDLYVQSLIISGALTVESAASASLFIREPQFLSGSCSASALAVYLALHIANTHELTGSTYGDAKATLHLQYAQLTGQALGEAHATVALAFAWVLSGQALGEASATGTLTVGTNLTPVLDSGDVTAACTVTRILGLSGRLSDDARSMLRLTLDTRLSGVLEAVAGAAGQCAVGRHLQGAIEAGAAVAAHLAVDKDPRGTAFGRVMASCAVHRDITLDGLASQNAQLTGDLATARAAGADVEDPGDIVHTPDQDVFIAYTP